MYEATVMEMGEEGVNDVAEMKSEGFGKCKAKLSDQLLELGVLRKLTAELVAWKVVWRFSLLGKQSEFRVLVVCSYCTLEMMLRRGYETNVIVLRKYHAAALNILYETDYFTFRNGFNWMENGNSINSQVDAIRSDEEMVAFDKIIYYLFNAEALRHSAMQHWCANTQFVEMRPE